MQKVKIAVIDNGVDHTQTAYEIKRKIYVNSSLQCEEDTADMKSVNFTHGTICVSVIQSCFADGELYSIRILDEDGRGFINRFETALSWCYENDIFLVNLSLGTTYFKDIDKMREMVNYYANRGMCMIAAGSNGGYTTYPASLSHVIGVIANGNKHSGMLENRLRGMDVFAPSRHEIVLHGEKCVLPSSNSYATPFVTALCGKIIEKKKCKHIIDVKNELREHAGSEIRVVQGYSEPDWISHAQICMKNVNHREYYYFQTSDGGESAQIADTVIIDDLAEMEYAVKSGKHIVYLGKEKFEGSINHRFYWSPYDKEKLISGCEGRCAESELPVIMCRLCDGIDEIFLLTEIKRCFSEEGYNIYTASMVAEGILCDLDYIPEKSMSEEDKVRKYIQMQTHLKQCDGIVIGGNSDDAVRLKALFAEIDVEISIKRAGTEYEILVCGEEHAIWKQSHCAQINAALMKTMVDKIISAFTEEE